MGQICSCVEPRRKLKRERRLSDASTEGGADDGYGSDGGEIRIIIDGDGGERDSLLGSSAATATAMMTKRGSKSALLRAHTTTAVAHVDATDERSASGGKLLGDQESDPLSAMEQRRNLEVLRSYQKATGVVDPGQHDLECIMCLDNFSSENPKVRTLCNCGMNRTNFHLSCLLEWLNRDANCPVCRQYLFYEEP